MSGCPPDLALELYQLGEIAGTASAVWIPHIESCARCRDALDAIAADDAAYVAPPLPVAPIRARASRWRAATAALALAAGVAAGWLWRPLPSDTLGIKGAGILTVALEGAMAPWGGEALVPGTRLQLVWTGAEPGYLAVIAIERDGTSTTLHPAHGREAVAVRAARALPLGDSLILDAAHDGARVCALFAPSPFVVDAEQRQACDEGRAAAHLVLRVRR